MRHSWFATAAVQEGATQPRNLSNTVAVCVKSFALTQQQLLDAASSGVSGIQSGLQFTYNPMRQGTGGSIDLNNHNSCAMSYMPNARLPISTPFPVLHDLAPFKKSIANHDINVNDSNASLQCAKHDAQSMTNMVDFVCAESQASLTLDPLDFMRCCTFRIICALSFGLPMDAFSLQETQSFVASVHTFFKVMCVAPTDLYLTGLSETGLADASSPRA